MKLALSILMLPGLLCGEVVDTIVAVAGGHAIKRSDVMKELRLTAFLNRARVDLSTDKMRESVNRLIDQVLIKAEMEAGMYATGNEDKTRQELARLRTERGGPGAFQQALRDYGITEPALRERLEWQASVLEFVDIRFGAEQDQSSTDRLAEWLNARRQQERIEIREERLK